MEPWFILIPITIIGLISFVIFKVAVAQQRRARAHLGAIAQRYHWPEPVVPAGFWARFRSMPISGPWRGRELRIYNYTTGSGKHTTHWCAIAATVHNPGNFTLRISRENVLTRVGRVFGLDDVTTGDPAFDGQFYVKSNDPDFIAVALIPEVRAALVEAWRDHPRGAITVEGQQIIYAEPGTFSSPKICGRIPGFVELACVLAEVVEARPPRAAGSDRSR